MRLQLVIHALFTDLACLSFGGKKFQSIPIKVSSALSEIFCIGKSGNVEHGSCSLENSELYYLFSTSLSHLWLSGH